MEGFFIWKWGKIRNFLDPPPPSPRMLWAFLHLGKIGNFMADDPLPYFCLTEAFKVYIYIWKNLKIRTAPPTSSQKVQILNFGLFDFWHDPHQ